MTTSPAAGSDSISETGRLQRFQLRDPDDVKTVLDAVDFTPLASAVSTDPLTGRRPYERLPIVRAHFAAYLTKPKIDSIVTLHLSIMRDAALREACGFSGPIPSRSTFSRVFTAMSEHPDIVDRCAAEVVARMKEIIPDLGEEIAADSTPVPSYSNSDRNPKTDPDASWGWHRKAGAKDGSEWVWGYKAHVLADANHDIPPGAHLLHR